MVETNQQDPLSVAEMQRLEESTIKVPPYIFRAFSVGGSHGINNETKMQPVQNRGIPRRSIFARSRAEVRDMLRAHLLWQYGSESNFISWSSSMLWVLDHAARMHVHERKPNVHIAVLDTRKIDDMTLFPATALMEVYNVTGSDVKTSRKLRREYYISEYLFYGALRNVEPNPIYRCVSWDAICQADLCNSLCMFSRRDPTRKQLLRLIHEHRQAIFDAEPTATKWNEILPVVVRISSLWGMEYELPLTVALMTILCGNSVPSSAQIRASLCNFRTHSPVDPESIVAFDNNLYIDERLTEVNRMYNLMRDVLSPQSQRDLENVTMNFNSLRVEQ